MYMLKSGSGIVYAATDRDKFYRTVAKQYADCGACEIIEPAKPKLNGKAK